MALQPVTKKQAKITIAQAGNYLWSSAKGGDLERDTVQYTDPADNMTKTVVGLTKVTDQTLTKVYDPTKDGALIKWCQKQMEKPTPFSVSVQPISADAAGSNISGAGTFQYPNCVMTKFKNPEFDTESSGVAMIEITVAINSRPTYS